MEEIVTLNVVGIRHYLNDEDKEMGDKPASYTELFTRVPVGSAVYLKVEPEGSKYPGAISVFDNNIRKIGNVSKHEIRFIRKGIPKDGILCATVTEHCPQDNSMKIRAVNSMGVEETDNHIPESNDEKIFLFTDDDSQLQNISAFIRTKIETLEKEITIDGINSLIPLLKQFSDVCINSLDNPTSLLRNELIQFLETINRDHPELYSEELRCVHKVIFEKHKDLGRCYNDIMISTFHKQFDEIKKQAYTPNPDTGKTPLDDYYESLSFTHGGSLSEDIIMTERCKLADLLEKSLDNQYANCVGNDKEFSNKVYYLDYNLRSIYILYTRRIKYEYLGQLLGEIEAKYYKEHPLAKYVTDKKKVKRIIDWLHKKIEKKKNPKDMLAPIKAALECDPPALNRITFKEMNQEFNINCSEETFKNWIFGYRDHKYSKDEIDPYIEELERL